MNSPLSQVTLEYVDSVEKVNEFWRWLSEDRNRPRLVVDLETSGLRRDRDCVRLAQFGDTLTGWAIPYETWGGLAHETVKKWQGDWVGHNLSFDQAFLSRDMNYKWPWHRSHDTMLMAHCLNPARTKALKGLTSLLIDRTAAAGQDALTRYMKNNNLDWGTVPVDNPYYWGYGAMDTVLTARLYEIFESQVKAQCPGPYDLEMAVSRVCANMERLGARIDFDYCVARAKTLREYAHRWRDQARSEFGIENATSLHQLRKFFADQPDIVLDKLTDKGDLAMDKEVLGAIDHPLAALVLKIRKAEKLCSTYLDNFEHMADDEGVLHPTIWTCGTRTARMSITDPALQTLPKDDKVIRNAFIPREGRAWISCDADQIELRLMAHFAKDQGLIDAFKSDEDFFCHVASEALGEPIGKEDPRRKMMKSSVYARQYGAGAAKIAKTARVPVERIKELNAAFDEMYPGVKRFMNATTEEVMHRAVIEGHGYVFSEGGRKIPTEAGKDYVGVNYKLQTTAAEILKRGLVDLDSAGFGDYMTLPVHDEINLDVPKEEAEEVHHEVGRVLEATTTGEFAVPLTWSADLLPGAWGGRELETKSA